MIYYDILLYTNKLWYTMIRYDTLWYTVIYCDILWYTMIYYDTLWYTMIHYDTLWYTMKYYDVLWYTMIYYDTLWYTLIYYDLGVLGFTILGFIAGVPDPIFQSKLGPGRRIWASHICQGFCPESACAGRYEPLKEWSGMIWASSDPSETNMEYSKTFRNSEILSSGFIILLAQREPQKLDSEVQILCEILWVNTI